MMFFVLTLPYFARGCCLACVVLLGAVACESPRSPAPVVLAHVDQTTVPECRAPLRMTWSSDSLVALCLPSGFHERIRDNLGKAFHLQHYNWERFTPNDGATFVTVSMLYPQDNAIWPPSLSGQECDTNRMSHCEHVKDVRVYTEHLGGVPRHIEIGSMHRDLSEYGRPTLVAGWDIDGARKAMVRMEAGTMATLDTLRASISTVRVSP